MEKQKEQDVLAGTTAIQSSLVNQGVYYACHTAHETMDNLNGELCALRRRFFEGDKKGCRLKEQGVYMGCTATAVGSMRRHSFKWKKWAEKVNLEEGFSMGKSFVVVRRDFNGTICGKIHYDYALRWVKTEYFAPEDYMTAAVMMKPRESSDGIELFTYDTQRKAYNSKMLYPVPYTPGQVAQSILNTKYGAPEILIATQAGTFSYCGKEEQKKRLKDIDGLNNGAISTTPAWEPQKEAPMVAEAEQEQNLHFTNLFEPVGLPVTLPELQEETPVETLPPLPEEEPLLLDTDLVLEVENAQEPEKEPIFVQEEPLITFLEEAPQVGLVQEGEQFLYTGKLVSGKRQGRGRTEQENGLTLFDGNYKDDLRHGFGAAYTPQGSLRYAGFWQDDKKEGGGVSFREKDGAMHISPWEQDKPTQWTALFDAKGKLRYYGRICNGKKIGAGVTLQEDGLFVGKYQDQDQPTQGALFDQNGCLIYSGGWKNGKRHGQGVSFDQMGQVIYVGQWKDDQYHNGVLYQKIGQEHA